MTEDSWELVNGIFAAATARLEDAAELAAAGQSQRLKARELAACARRLGTAAQEIAILAQAARILAQPSPKGRQTGPKIRR